eukprot:TRINITY_DN17679_c0_g1_i5.p1 TRINITY_DN17679_c0_g1~~TRINITY_DN17679_c0_g1_i5.p1  ORF type:complete len:192 (-),score=23.58 TRINITY_DN17679_c0_g1_i5:76-651(-)
MVRSLVLLLVLACPLCTEATRIGEALDVNQSALGGCSAEQCSACCCKVTALQYTNADLELHETMVATAKHDYSSMPTCRGVLHSKLKMFGACGTLGCKACSTSTLAACERPYEWRDTCCMYLLPTFKHVEWRLKFVPWHEMRGKSCSEYVRASTRGSEARQMKKECCEKNKVDLGWTKEYVAGRDWEGCVR